VKVPDTVAQAIRRARELLTRSGVEDARLEAEVLLAHALRSDRTSLRAFPERTIASDARCAFEDLLEKRATGVPVAYLTGVREFWSLELNVTPATLIPRAETERLVDLALEVIPGDAAWSVADLGTGSGAIALALARERPRCRVVATDVSSPAIAVAAENALRHGLANIEWRVGDWFAATPREQFDVVVSNPPYIAAGDPHLARGDLRFEPVQALTCGDDALRDLRTIISSAPLHLRAEGTLLVEHGFDQRDAVRDLFRASGFRNIEVFDDYAGVPRVVRGIKG
jgi:release factor glutamine methyltransferase